METPDVTKAQIIAIIQPVVTCAVAFGAPITDAQSVALIGLATAISTALTLGDAIIRNGRSRALMSPEVVREMRPLPEPYVNDDDPDVRGYR